METRRDNFVFCCVAVFCFWACASDSLYPESYIEVLILKSIKASLEDPNGVLNDWVGDEVDPCSWTRVTCSPDHLVIGLTIPSQNLSGVLSPSIGNLTHLQIVLLQNNNISGSIPSELGRLSKLQTLDLRRNSFTGEIPTSLAHLKRLQYLRLNNNSLSGAIPSFLANLTQLAFLDLSYNNLSGPVPRLLARTFNFNGNPLICATGTEEDCYGMALVPASSNSNNSQKESQSAGRPKSWRVALAFGLGLGCICLLIPRFYF